MIDPFILFTKYLGALILPPSSGFLLALFGAWRLTRGKGGGLTFACLWGGLALSVALSLLPVGNWLLSTVEKEPALDLAAARGSGAQAVVILAGGKVKGAIEYGGETTNRYSAERVRYGARVARALGLPILVSGGKPTGGVETEAALMARSLVDDYGLQPKWVEGRSLTTFDNAREARGLLAPLGVKRIVLVSDAVHIRRARLVFEDAGFEVIAAPTGFMSLDTRSPIEWLPSAEGLRRSYLACHEWLGWSFYRLRLALARR